MTARLISFTVSLAPVPELGLVLQIAGLGAAVGSAVALRARHRDASADTWRVTTAWATLGLAIGVVIALVSAVS